MESIIFAILVIGATNTVITVTLSKGLPFRGLREWVRGKWETLADTLECPYCLAHWTALPWIFFSPIPQGSFVIVDLLVWWGLLVYVTAFLSGVLFLMPPLSNFFRYPPPQHEGEYEDE
jgi:hypothetical protein